MILIKNQIAENFEAFEWSIRSRVEDANFECLSPRKQAMLHCMLDHLALNKTHPQKNNLPAEHRFVDILGNYPPRYVSQAV